MKVPVLSSLILFHARQAGGGYHSFLPSGGGPRTHTGVSDDNETTERGASNVKKGSHISRGQWAHQVTSATLYILL